MLPNRQFLPVYDGKQKHEYALTPLVQDPPLRHGALTQLSTTKMIPKIV